MTFPLSARAARLMLAGGLGVLAAVGIQWLIYSAFDSAPFPAYQAGERFIRESPGAMATWAIDNLGKDAKTGLALGAVAIAVGAGVVAGLLRTWIVGASLGGLVLVAGVAAPVGPEWRWQVGVAVVSGLFAWAVAAVVAPTERQAVEQMPGRRPVGRRTLIGGGAVAAAVVVTGLAIWRPARESEGLGEVRAARRLSLEPDASFSEVDGLRARITAPADHYRVDINFAPPPIERQGWRLDLTGMVDEPRALAFDELVALGPVEQAVFLQCVSNSVGGSLLGNANWTCVPLASVIDLAQPDERASAFVATAEDGYHETFPIEAAATMFVTVGMGGREIPPNHGHPVRLLYPGHYGMRSVKWLQEVRLIGAFPESYWSERGWEQEAVLKVGSRIDAPRGGTEFAGPVVLAGVAWGPQPVTAVEVSYDDGATWMPAQLEAETGPLAWRRWQASVEAPTGEHQFVARAHCGALVQIAEPANPHPDGATGLHKVTAIVL